MNAPAPTPAQVASYRRAVAAALDREPADSPQGARRRGQLVADYMQRRYGLPTIHDHDGYRRLRPDWREQLTRLAFENDPIMAAGWLLPRSGDNGEPDSLPGSQADAR